MSKTALTSSGVKRNLKRGSDPSELRERIVRIAGELFLKQGFEGVSLEMIVAKTGGSFRDLYREFGSKKKLFLLVMRELCDEVVSPLHGQELLGGDGIACPIEDALYTLGKRVLETLLSERLLALHRLVLSEAKRFPALAKTWYERGPNGANQALATLLVKYENSGYLQVADASLAAAIFLDSLINNLQLRALTGHTVLAAEIDQRVRASVHIFLNGTRLQMRTTNLVRRGAPQPPTHERKTKSERQAQTLHAD